MGADEKKEVGHLGRKHQSIFITSFLSDKGERAVNNDYFTYAELPEYAFWLAVDGNSDGIFEKKIAQYIGKMIKEQFLDEPTMDRKKLEKLLFTIHKRYREIQKENTDILDEYSTCSIAMAVTDYSNIIFVNIGSARFMLMRDGERILRSRDHTVAYLMYESNKIKYDEIRYRRDKNTLTHKFGIDRSIVIDISDTVTLMPDDRILLLTHGAWENLSERDIYDEVKGTENKGYWVDNIATRIKENVQDTLGNYTICGIYVSRPAPPLPPPVIPKSNFGDNIKKYGKYIVTALVIIVLFVCVDKYHKQRKSNRLYAAAVEKENTGNMELEKGNFLSAQKEYMNSIENYRNYYNYIGNKDTEKEEQLQQLLEQAKLSQDIYQEIKEAKNLLHEKEFDSAVNKLATANEMGKQLNDDTDLKNELKSLTIIADLLNKAYSEKLKADKLFDQATTNGKDRQKLRKEANDIYEKVAIIFLENDYIDIYDEIMAKQVIETSKEPKKIIKRAVTAEELLAQGNKAFDQFKYYKSFDLYQNALKKSRNKKTTEIINGKIYMNDMLLKGVKAELDGDKMLRENKNRRGAVKKYKEAKGYYERLKTNEYMPKKRYQIIMDRIGAKIRG